MTFEVLKLGYTFPFFLQLFTANPEGNHAYSYTGSNPRSLRVFGFSRNPFGSLFLGPIFETMWACLKMGYLQSSNFHHTYDIWVQYIRCHIMLRGPLQPDLWLVEKAESCLMCLCVWARIRWWLGLGRIQRRLGSHVPCPWTGQGRTHLFTSLREVYLLV